MSNKRCGVCSAVQNHDRLVMESFGSRDDGFIKIFRCQNHQRVPPTILEIKGV